MTDKKISGLTELAEIPAANDVLAIVDTSAGATKKIRADTILPYKRYVALLTQTGTAAPVATVLENTLGGTPVWARNGAGDYKMTLASAWVADKTVVTITPTHDFSDGVDAAAIFEAARADANIVTLATRSVNFGVNVGTGVQLTDELADDLLTSPFVIEARVYP